MHIPTLLTFLTTTALAVAGPAALPADDRTNNNAGPLLPRQGTTTPQRFRLNVRFSNTPTLSGALHASGGSFWLHKPTTSFCPGESVLQAPCPPGNETSLTGGGPDGRLSLNVAVPGGQQVFIGPRGLLRYTRAHSGDMPRGSITSGLTVQEGTRFLNPFYQLWLCNTDEDDEVWQVWVEQRDAQGSQKNWGSTGRNACTRINLEAEEVKDEVGAWQYD
ncbi:hypothetical protein B0J12DRAFT_596909 [Macrophomina phaseolina]|uniref:Uncharacterized protein n=1 Tax=Macrophomina phaseolina TaxID=35725 RepID=A0ABQ8GHL5_9PEZI|nr:hypothetical protein B0J12DRAFT_596909 [Macrophomina phaseolina]